jgi:hypothetical protein
MRIKVNLIYGRFQEEKAFSYRYQEDCFWGSDHRPFLFGDGFE